jgi:phage shock protein A
MNPWKAKLQADTKASSNDPAGQRRDRVEELRLAVNELETDLAGVTGRITEALSKAGAYEDVAMQAIRRGDDVGARDALRRQHVHLDVVPELEAEVVVIRAMIAECRLVLDEADASRDDNAST